MVLNMELDDLFQAQRQLSEKDLIIYNAELQKKTKSVGLAYCLLIFFGWLGLHKFYLGKIGEGIVYLIFGTIYFVFLQIFIFNVDRHWEPTVFFILFFGTFGFFLFYDLFTLHKKIIDYEKLTQIDLLSKFGINFDTIIISDINNNDFQYYILNFLTFFNDKINISYNSFVKIFLVIIALFFITKDSEWLFNSKFENEILDLTLTGLLFFIVILFSYELLDYFREYKKNIFIISSVLLVALLVSNFHFFELLEELLVLVVFTWSFFEFVDFLIFKCFSYKHPPKANIVRMALIFLLMWFINDVNVFIWFLLLLTIIPLYYFIDKFNLHKGFKNL